MKKNVTIYTTPSCVYCKMAKEFFQEHKIDYTEYDVASDAPRREEMIKITGQMGVPVIEVDGDITIGFDRSKLSQLLL